MSTEVLSKFDFEGQQVRTVMDDNNEPWFVLADVCKVLGLSNPSAVKNGLNNKDVNTLSSIEGIKGRGANATTVNESGLYDVPRHWSLTTA